MGSSVICRTSDYSWLGTWTRVHGLVGAPINYWYLVGKHSPTLVGLGTMLTTLTMIRTRDLGETFDTAPAYVVCILLETTPC